MEDAIEDLVEMLTTGEYDRMIAVMDGPETDGRVIHFGIEAQWVPQLLEELAAYIRENDWDDA